MPVVTSSLEGGTNGTTLTTGNTGGSSGNAFDFVSAGGTNIFDTAHAMHGTLANKIATVAAATAYCQWTSASFGSPAQAWFRLYGFFTANPANQHRVLNLLTTGGASSVGSAFVTTAGKLLFTNSAGATVLTSAASIPLNSWFRLEGFAVGSATVGQWSFSLWSATPDAPGSPDETQTSAASQSMAGVVAFANFGCSSSVASVGPFWQDDMGISTTGPLGPAVPPATVPVVVPAAAVMQAANW